MSDAVLLEKIGQDYKYGFHDEGEYVYKSNKGLTREIVETISKQKNEPAWMLEERLKALLAEQLEGSVQGHGKLVAGVGHLEDKKIKKTTSSLSKVEKSVRYREPHQSSM